ncbi:hypothetical protein CJU90_1224 [Yarrowia sp. C11]|nr:hypothetical protein CKK34_2638 [Yarrowia sp. E02]KAG5373511.1 hypothetical protein CJU90_1224 [Yarrowia sp. C11]
MVTTEHDIDEKPPTNPFANLVKACPDPQCMQQAYERHRRTRNKDKSAELRSRQIQVKPDAILSGLLNGEPPEFDPRNCITLWGRPTSDVIECVRSVQQQLTEVTEALWCMPPECLHLSILEVAHSVTEETVQNLLQNLKPTISDLKNVPEDVVLVKPLVCFDNSAVALTLVPDDHSVFTYTHYRAWLHKAVSDTGVQVESRYQVPSAHITIGRFTDTVDEETVDAFVTAIETINEKLENSALEWHIGEEREVEVRCGRIWYGGGWNETSNCERREQVVNGKENKE